MVLEGDIIPFFFIINNIDLIPSVSGCSCKALLEVLINSASGVFVTPYFVSIEIICEFFD
jgi:hypothetical protein